MTSAQDQDRKPAVPASARPLARLFDSALGSDTAFLLARVSAWTSMHGNRNLEPLALNVRSYSVLALSCSGTAPTQRECAEFLSLDPSRVVALIDELEKRHLVRRVAIPHDRRTKTVQATAAGRELLAKAQEATKRAELEALGHLPADARARLQEDLRMAADFTD